MKVVNNVKEFVQKYQWDIFMLAVVFSVVTITLLHGHGAEASATADATMDKDLPWNTGVSKIFKEMTGPLPKIGSGIAIGVSGLMMTFGELQGMTKKAMQVVFGLGIACGAPGLVNSIGNTSGTLF